MNLELGLVTGDKRKDVSHGGDEGVHVQVDVVAKRDLRQPPSRMIAAPGMYSPSNGFGQILGSLPGSGTGILGTHVRGVEDPVRKLLGIGRYVGRSGLLSGNTTHVGDDDGV